MTCVHWFCKAKGIAIWDAGALGNKVRQAVHIYASCFHDSSSRCRHCRWDAAAQELVCDELGVAYPVINGMPNLRPADGRVIEVGDRDADPLAQPWGDDADAAGSGQRQPLQATDAKPQ